MTSEFKNLKVKSNLPYEEFLDFLDDIKMLSVMRRNGNLIGINVSSEIIDNEISNKVALILNAGWSIPEETREAMNRASDELEMDAYLPEVYKRKNSKFSSCKALRDKFIRLTTQQKLEDLLKPETWSWIEDSRGQIIGKGKKDNEDLRPYDEDDDPENEPIVQMLELIGKLEKKQQKENNR